MEPFPSSSLPHVVANSSGDVWAAKTGYTSSGPEDPFGNQVLRVVRYRQDGHPLSTWEVESDFRITDVALSGGRPLVSAGQIRAADEASGLRVVTQPTSWSPPSFATSIEVDESLDILAATDERDGLHMRVGVAKVDATRGEVLWRIRIVDAGHDPARANGIAAQFGGAAVVGYLQQTSGHPRRIGDIDLPDAPGTTTSFLIYAENGGTSPPVLVPEPTIAAGFGRFRAVRALSRQQRV
jgi:hypothetical protein